MIIFRLFNAHSSTPTPVFLPSREETQTMVREKLGPNSDHPRLCIYWGNEKLRPWSEFLGRENSDHGLSFGCFWGRGRRGGSQLFRSLQLQFSGPTGINFRYSYSFVGLTGIFLYIYSSVPITLKMVRGIIFRKLQLQLHNKMAFELKM